MLSYKHEIKKVKSFVVSVRIVCDSDTSVKSVKLERGSAMQVAFG